MSSRLRFAVSHLRILGPVSFCILVKFGEDAVKWRPWRVGLQCESRQEDHIPKKAVMLYISRKSAGTTYLLFQIQNPGEIPR